MDSLDTNSEFPVPQAQHLQSESDSRQVEKKHGDALSVNAMQSINACQVKQNKQC
jgi:hypothetical protein